MDLKKEPVPATDAPSAQVDLVTVALVSGLGGPAVVTRRDGERLAKTGRWKIVGPAEKPVLRTEGFPGLPQDPAVEAPPQKPEAPAKVAAPAAHAPAVSFGEDHED